MTVRDLAGEHRLDREASESTASRPRTWLRSVRVRLTLAAVVATHELAEVVVIANGVRAARRTTRPGSPSSAVIESPSPTTVAA